MANRALLLPFIEPPGERIDLDLATVSTVLGTALEKDERIAHSPIGLRGGELSYLVKRRGGRASFDKSRWTLMEHDLDLPDEAVKGVVALVTNSGEHVLRQTQHLKGPSPHPGLLRPPRYRLTPTRVEPIRNALALMAEKKSRRFTISVRRWVGSLEREDPLDSLLDCCSSLEALFGLSDELRLRLAFAVYTTVSSQKKAAGKLTYEMYGLRNVFIHGGKITSFSDEQQLQLVRLVRRVLLSVARRGSLPGSQELSSAVLGLFD